MSPDYSSYSFWLETCGDDLTPRPPLSGDETVDVAIVGGGFGGLWTAYYLAKADPSLRIAVVEKKIAGFGASGRNGGWCTATFAVSGERIARLYGRDAALAMQRAMFETVDEVGKVCREEGIDAHYVKGGTVTVATTAPQAERLRGTVADGRGWGWSEEDLGWLEPAEVRERIEAEGCRGGTYTPHCAALHPARLARGLARTVEGLGVRIHEGTVATGIERGRVPTDHGTIRCEVAVRALEGYTDSVPGHRRLLLPLQIFMVATEALPSSFWDEVGWRRGETLGDASYTYLYAQRTRDDRIAVGGRSARYAYASGVRDLPGGDEGSERRLRRVLRELFPAIGEARVSHRWGGFIGIPRDWFA